MVDKWDKLEELFALSLSPGMLLRKDAVGDEGELFIEDGYYFLNNSARTNIASRLISIIKSHLKPLSDEEIKEALYKVQPDGFDWVDSITDSEKIKYRAISQSAIDNILERLE